MSAAQWLGLAVAAAATAAFSFWIYLRREVPVAGRRLLAGVRAAVLAIVVLLLLDPSVPGAGSGARGARSWVAVDGSLSMGVLGGGEETPWERARSRALELAGRDVRLTTFAGEGAAPGEGVAALEGQPAGSSTLLAPFLERAIESGAREVVVLSDLRIADPLAVRALLERGSLTVRFEDVGGAPPNAGVARWELPASVEGGESVAAELAVYASEAAQGRTATVEVREEERLVHSSDVVLPPAGRLLTLTLDLPAPTARGTVRYEARVRLETDVLADDDARVRFVELDPEEGLLVVVGLAPDWELRFLLPLLTQVTGLEGRSYFRVAPDRFVRGGDQPESLDGAELKRWVEGAEILVVQGLGADAPSWLAEASRGRRRLLVFPKDVEGASTVGIAAGSALGGEWYVAGELPPSPLAADLGGAKLQGLPPLTQLLPVSRDGQGETPLLVQLRGSGPGEPALLLTSGEGGRRAVALGSGFWRWAFREGAARDAYRRLWAGVAGWLLADAVTAGGAFLRPSERVVARGQAVSWTAPGAVGREVALRITRADSTVLDTVVAVSGSGALTTPPLPPGSYAYRGEATDGEGGSGEGRLEVESYTEELRHTPARDLLDVRVASAEERAEGESRPLRTHPAPYLLLLGLLCGEWIGRRRKGLR